MHYVSTNSKVLFLGLLGLASASVLDKRQLCLIGANPLTACGDADFTSANWASFDVDTFLFGIIRQEGISDNFPRFFGERTRGDGFAGFDCSSFDSTTCSMPGGENPRIETDCNFDGIETTFCANFKDPKAGFVIVNYIRMFEYLRNHYNALEDVRNDVRGSNFINSLVDGFKPEDNNIALEVFKLIGNILLDAVPLGRGINTARQFIRAASRQLDDAVRENAIPGGIDIARAAAENSANARNAEGLKATLNTQLDDIIDSARSRLEWQLSLVFGPNQDPNSGSDDPAATFAFKAAKGGRYLDAIPSREDFFTQIKDQIQLIFLAEIIGSFGYTVVVDNVEILFADQACIGNGGISILNRCTLFRQTNSRDFDTAFNAKKPTDTTITRALIRNSFVEMVNNAERCSNAGRSITNDVEFDAFVDPGSEAEFPECLFDFPVLRN